MVKWLKPSGFNHILAPPLGTLDIFVFKYFDSGKNSTIIETEIANNVDLHICRQSEQM